MPVEGTVTDTNSNAVQGATVYVVDATNDTLLGSDTTDASGNYSVTVDTNTTAHVIAQYNDGNTDYNALSKPYVDVTPLLDSFEDQSHSEYDNLDSSVWTWNQNSKEGTYATRASNNDNPIVSDSGLNNYPSPGDTFRIWIRSGEDSPSSNGNYFPGMHWAVADTTIPTSSNGYRAVFLPGGGELYIQENSGGSYSTVTVDTVYSGYTAQEWVELEVYWPSDPTSTPMEARIYTSDGTQQGSTSGTSSNAYTNSSWGLDATLGGASGTAPWHEYDYARIM